MTDFARQLAVVLLAGCAVAGVAALLHLTLRRASNATRAAAMQACLLVLLVLSLLELMPQGWRRIAAAPAPRAIATLAAPMAAPMQSLTTWSGSAPRSHGFAPPIAAALVSIWSLGVLLSLFRLLRSASIVRGIRRRARRGDRHRVVVSDEIDIPFVHGIRAPVIVVPAQSATWTDEVWHAVLRHESSHIARGDVAALWARHVVLALHWCNPAIHWLARRAEEACEGACDDDVLLRGTTVESYAETLLGFASAGWRVPTNSVPTMARRSGLERRLLALLNDDRRRRTPRRRDRFAPLVAGTCAGVLLATALPLPAAAVASAEVMRQIRSTPAPARVRDTARRDRAPAQPPTVNDTTEALLGLAALLDDGNPIVRATARDALHAWGGVAVTHLAPIARAGDGDRRRNARAALTALERS